MLKAKDRMPGLDFLRAFAALWVLAFHFMELVPVALRPIEFNYYVTVGWNGVDLFFVLSGFLIGTILCREGENVRAFMIRRFFRIYPAYILTVVVCILILKPYLLDNKLLVVSHVFLFNNLIPGYGGAVNGVLWTLGAEFQFYILAALILLLPAMRGFWWWLITLVVAGSLFYRLFIFDTMEGLDRYFYTTQLPGMLGLFGMGFLAVHVKQKVGGYISRFFPFFLLVAVAGFYFYLAWLRTRFGIYWDLKETVVLGRFYSGLAFFALVLVFSCAPNYVGRAIKAGGFVFLGEISYGLYLTHLFVLECMRPYELIFAQYHWAFYMVSYLSAVFALSCLVYFAVERPFIRIGAGLAAKTMRSDLPVAQVVVR